MINYLVLIKEDTILLCIHYLGTGDKLRSSGQGGGGGGSNGGGAGGGGGGGCRRRGAGLIYLLDKSHTDKCLSCVKKENQSALLNLHLVSPSKIVQYKHLLLAI